MNVLTRANRRKAGIPPPTPFFKSSLPKCSVVWRNNSGRQQEEQSPTYIPQDQAQHSNDSEDSDMLWVQCDECKKWRKVTSHSAEGAKEWYCHMNPNPQYQSCEASEEDWNLPEGLIYTYKGLTPGQLVWGKLKTYPAWPAIVTPDPFNDGNYIEEMKTEGCIYHVEFLGKPKSHSWLPEEMVEPYRETCSIGGRFCPSETKVSIKLQKAMEEARGLQSLTNDERLEQCQYIPEKLQGKAVKRHRRNKSNSSSTKECTSSSSKKPYHLHSSKLPPSAVKSEPNPPLVQLTPLDMVNSLAVLKMLGVPIDNDSWFKACNKPTKLDEEPTKRDQPKEQISLKGKVKIERGEKKTYHQTSQLNPVHSPVPTKSTATSCNSNKVTGRGRPKLPVQAKRTADLCLQRQRKGKKERTVARKRRSTSTPSSSVAMQNIEKYFKSPDTSTQEYQQSDPAAAGDGDGDSRWRRGLVNDQVVPDCESMSLDVLERDAQDSLTDISKLLESLNDNQEAPLLKSKFSPQGHPDECHDQEIDSLVCQLTQMEDIIENFEF